MVQGFIFEGDLQFSKLFKNTISRCLHSKVHWKAFYPFYPPSFFFLNVSPIMNLKEALNISTGMYCNTHLLEIMRRSAFPFILSILLAPTTSYCPNIIILLRLISPWCTRSSPLLVLPCINPESTMSVFAKSLKFCRNSWERVLCLSAKLNDGCI